MEFWDDIAGEGLGALDFPFIQQSQQHYAEIFGSAVASGCCPVRAIPNWQSGLTVGQVTRYLPANPSADDNPLLNHVVEKL